MLLVSAEAQRVAKDPSGLEGIAEDVLIDGFVTEPDVELELQTAADMLRAPAVEQSLLDELGQLTLNFSPGDAGLSSTAHRGVVGHPTVVRHDTLSAPLSNAEFQPESQQLAAQQLHTLAEEYLVRGSVSEHLSRSMIEGVLESCREPSG